MDAQKNHNFRLSLFQLFSIFVVFLVPFSCGQDKRPVEDLVKELATRFCMAEFNGDVSARIELVFYDEKHLSKMDPMFKPGVYFFDFDPLKIVLSFKVGIPRWDGAHWAVPVEYEEFATRDRNALKGGKIFRHTKPKKIQTEIIIKDVQSKLVVFNPGIPHVGRDALLEEYNKDILISEKYVVGNPGASKPQLDSYRRRKEEYEILKSEGK